MRRIALYAAAIALSPSLASADELLVEDAWARATAATASVGAAYFRIDNRAADDRLIGAAAEVAKMVEIHDHILESGVARMVEIGTIDAPGGAVTMLEPGGLHLMLMGLEQPLVEGEEIVIDLEFENAGAVTVTAPILSAGARGLAE